MIDERFKEILENLPPKPPRSRLEPYDKLIRELRRRGTTYRKIAEILAEKCQFETSASTIHDFVRLRWPTDRPGKRQRTVAARIEPGDATRGVPRNTPAQLPSDEVRQRIASLKLLSAPIRTKPNRFQYDPDEPLQLPAKYENKQRSR
jgi:hypothetical protein